MIVEILSVVAGSSLVSNIITGLMYWSSSRKLKESEARSACAEASLKEVETKIAEQDGEHKAREQLHEIIIELNNQMKDIVISGGDLVDIINKQFTEEMKKNAELTERLRTYQDECLSSKNLCITLMEENSNLKMKLEHYKNWVCEREYTDCLRRKPELKIKCPYVKIDE